MVRQVHIILKKTGTNLRSKLLIVLSRNKNIQGLLALYVDDTLALGTETFMKLTGKLPEEFDSRSKEFPPLLFSGVTVNPDPLDYFLEQNKYLEKLPGDFDFNLFRTTRHRLACITQKRQKILAGVKTLSQVTKEKVQ